MLAGDVPGILYRSGDFYATAAAGSAAAVFAVKGLDRTWWLILGVGVGVMLRLGPRLLDIRLPVPRPDRLSSSDAMD